MRVYVSSDSPQSCFSLRAMDLASWPFSITADHQDASELPAGQRILTAVWNHTGFMKEQLHGGGRGLAADQIV